MTFEASMLCVRSRMATVRRRRNADAERVALVRREGERPAARGATGRGATAGLGRRGARRASWQ